MNRMESFERVAAIYSNKMTFVVKSLFKRTTARSYFDPLNRRGRGGIRPQDGSFLCCAETVSSKKLKLFDFYYILIGLNSDCKPVPWDIHCCHGNTIVEGCSVECWLKSVENCIFLLKSFSNLSLKLLFVINISKLPPVPIFKQIGLKTKKLGFSTFLVERSLKYKMTS